MIDQAGRRIGVYGLAIHDRKVLLVRVAGGFPGAGLWTLPGGGMEWGESPLECLSREFFEETGLTAADPDPLDLRSEVLVTPDGREVHSLQLVYRVTAHGTLRHERGGSTEEAAWHAVDSLPSSVPLVAQMFSDGLVPRAGR